MVWHLWHEADDGAGPLHRILGFDPVLDHAGPMTTNVEDNVLFLEVLAGADGLDPRQVNPRVGDYTRGSERQGSIESS